MDLTTETPYFQKKIGPGEVNPSDPKVQRPARTSSSTIAIENGWLRDLNRPSGRKCDQRP